MKMIQTFSNVSKAHIITYAILVFLIPLVFLLFGVDIFRLFKAMFPRWVEIDEFAGQTAVLFTLLLLGGFNGYIISKITQRNRNRSSVSTVMLLRNSYLSSMVLTIPVILVSILLTLESLLNINNLLVLFANSLNVFAMLSFTSSVGVLVFLVLNGERRKRPIEVLKDESTSLVPKMVIVSILMIIIVRAVQVIFVSSLAGWDSLYHNTLITSILEGDGAIAHPFYDDLQNVYPPIYHYIMALLVVTTNLPLEFLVIAKEIIVFVLIAFVMYYLSQSLGIGKRASFLSVPIVFANLPGGGNRPQSVALLFALVTLYFLISAQQNKQFARSWLAGIFCGLLILTHFGLAMAIAIILLVNLFYMILKRDLCSVGYLLNCLGVSALVGALFMIPTLTIFPLSELLISFYLTAAVSFIILGPLCTHVLTRYIAPPVYNSKENEIKSRVREIESPRSINNNRIRIAVVTLFALSIVWGVLVGDHGYGIVSYATTGIFAPMGFLSIFVIPFAILAIYEIGAHTNWRLRGAFYSFAAPSFIGLIVYLANPFLTSIDTELYNVVGFLFSFNVYYLQLAVVGFAINASFYVTYVISPYISSVGKLPEARLVFRIFKTKETGVYLLLMTVLLAGTVSCRVGELTEFATIGPLFDLNPSERQYIESISQFTGENDIVLSDAYSSAFIPMITGRQIYFSIQPTANNFQAFEIGQRIARLKTIIYGPPEDLVRGLRSLNISVVFLWKIYPTYFRNITDTSPYIDFTNAITILKLAPDVSVLEEDNAHILVHL